MRNQSYVGEAEEAFFGDPCAGTLTEMFYSELSKDTMSDEYYENSI